MGKDPPPVDLSCLLWILPIPRWADLATENGSLVSWPRCRNPCNQSQSHPVESDWVRFGVRSKPKTGSTLMPGRKRRKLKRGFTLLPFPLHLDHPIQNPLRSPENPSPVNNSRRERRKFCPLQAGSERVFQNGAVTLGGVGDLSRITPPKPFAPQGGLMSLILYLSRLADIPKISRTIFIHKRNGPGFWT